MRKIIEWLRSTKGFGCLLAVLTCSVVGLLSCSREEPQRLSHDAGLENFKRPQLPPVVDSLFVDVTLSSGIDFRFSSGQDAGEFAILESLGGGVGVLDFDRDGSMDLLLAGGGSLANRTVSGKSCGLYRNLGGFKFVEATRQAGAAADRYYNQGIFPADYNNDGFEDVLVSGYGGLQLLRNQGDGTLVPAAPWRGRPDDLWSTGTAWGDFNGDGHLDIYVSHYVSWSWKENPPCFENPGGQRASCSPNRFNGLDDTLYLSDHQGGFHNATSVAQLVDGGKGLGVVAADLDLDGDTDIYVANDTTDNFLYLNDGQGVFKEFAILGGVSGSDVGVYTGSMGIAIGDCDDDGWPDILVTNFERELLALYRNETAASFNHVSRQAGLAAFGEMYVGFGAVFVDFDHDADQDIVVANGHVYHHSQEAPYLQQALLLENQGQGKYQRLPASGYFAEPHSGRGLATADLDNDGSLDLIFNNSEEPVAILAGRPPTTDRWAMIELVGVQANRDAIGATVQLVSDHGRQSFSRMGGGSYLSQSDPRMLLVLPENVVTAEVVVTWSGGHTESFPFPAHRGRTVWVERSSEYSEEQN